MSEAAEFLAKALDEAEAASNQAADHSRARVIPRWDPLRDTGGVIRMGGPIDNRPTSEQRRVAAGRKILELHRPADPSWTEVRLSRRIEPLKCNVCAEWNEYEDPLRVLWPCQTIVAFAGVYGWAEEQE